MHPLWWGAVFPKNQVFGMQGHIHLKKSQKQAFALQKLKRKKRCGFNVEMSPSL
jgi:hypothetical protein